MTNVLTAVDASEFERLFIQQLGWQSPTQQPISVIDPYGNTHTVTQVASFRGMGIWTCPCIPERDAQRQIDGAVAGKTVERLIIYFDEHHQEWRWPRSTSRKRSGPPTLVPHRHTVGQPNPALVERLGLIAIPMGSDITVPELLDRMREAFDREAETASKQAARLMGGLYEKLEVAGMGEQESSIFLARMLFLMFGDDTSMWKRNLFHDFLAEHTAPDSSDLREKLLETFLAADSPENQRPDDLSPGLRDLPYINGGIFADDIRIPDLDADFRKALLESCRFDWGQISPAVFGSMFQTVKTKEARRHLGEHYTTEENILRTIEPLFLDELRERLDAAWDDRKRLTKLHKELGELRFLDPACGCGNFLIVAYRELRALELALMIRQRDLAAAAGDHKAMQLAVDATHGLKVSIDHFYGIEIEAWPARIAETAMFLVDHQANQRMDHELGTAPTRLPLEVSPHIHLTNALTTNWNDVLPASNAVRIMGNPPFAGRYTRTKVMTEELKAAFGGAKGSGNIDFVCAWFARSADYMQTTKARAAFVSTNSIAQGEQPSVLWGYLSQRGMQIDFAWQTFPWSNAEPGEAAVHCVITGISSSPGLSRVKRLWKQAQGGGDAEEVQVPNINPYLAAAPNVLVRSRRSALWTKAPTMRFGSMPHDGGHLLLTPEERDEILEGSALASRYIRKVIGASELLKGIDRYCIWVTDDEQESAMCIPAFADRAREVEKVRIDSPDASANAAADRPLTFKARRQPTTSYIAVPRVSSERRTYIPMAFVDPRVIATDALLTIETEDLWVFGVLQSRAFNIWSAVVSGRLKSDFRISAEITYNNLPYPLVEVDHRSAVEQAAQEVLEARESHPAPSLADLYDPLTMPKDLLKAHQSLDRATFAAYRLPEDADETAVLSRLFSLYEELARADELAFEEAKPRRKVAKRKPKDG